MAGVVLRVTAHGVVVRLEPVYVRPDGAQRAFDELLRTQLVSAPAHVYHAGVEGDELKAQILRDAETTREYFAKA